MLNIADTLHTWCHASRHFALATVVQVSGSAPLPIGTASPWTPTAPWSAACPEDAWRAPSRCNGGCLDLDGAHGEAVHGPYAAAERYGAQGQPSLWCGRRSDRVVHRNPSTAPRVAIK